MSWADNDSLQVSVLVYPPPESECLPTIVVGELSRACLLRLRVRKRTNGYGDHPTSPGIAFVTNTVQLILHRLLLLFLSSLLLLCWFCKRPVCSSE
uniref:Uncharacterized protein n=1 Tax=Mesocestoides corti TaxID=53468 RepID=A0A5K3FNA6_MESCO